MPVTGPANVHQTGSQPACRTRHLVLPLAARSDSGRSYVRDNADTTEFDSGTSMKGYSHWGQTPIYPAGTLRVY